MSNDHELSKLTGSAKLIKNTHSYDDQNQSDGGVGDSYTMKSVYDTTWKNDEWENVTFSVDQVKISGENYSEASYENDGFVELDFTLDNEGEKTVCLHPDYAYAILTDNRRVDSDTFNESLENVFSKGKTQHGKIKFHFKNIHELDQLQAIYIKFYGHYKEDKEENLTHTYELPLYL